MTILFYFFAVLILLLAVFQYGNPFQPTSYALAGMFAFFLLAFISKKALSVVLIFGLGAVLLYAGFFDLVRATWNTFVANGE